MCLISNLAIYQYDSLELYLFARFFFDDLDNEMFQVFIEMRRILELQTQDVSARELVHVSALDDLVSQLFQNWERERHDLLIQQIYSLMFAKLQDGEKIPSMAIDFSELAGLVLYSLAIFRKTVYKRLTRAFGIFIQQQE